MTSDSIENTTDIPDSTSDEAPAAGVKAEATDPVEQLQEDLETAKAEAEQWRDRFLRKAAEMENFRKRSDRERSESSMLVKSSVLAEFLPVMDACERALDSFREDSGRQQRLQTYREGVELLYRQLGNALNRQGVVPLETKGRKFDPNVHEALTYLETLEYEDNTVIEELRRGYLLKERLLRPAQVIVASGPKPKDDSKAPL
jgi:molecular chaperone GrpE